MTAEVKKCDSLEFAAKAAAKTMKKPFSLTYLLYDEGDLLGYVMCIFSLLPILIMFSYGILLMFRRELHILSLTLGQLLNDVICLWMKKWIKQPRPNTAVTLLGRFDYGMPSQHSQFIFFCSAYLICCLIWRMTLGPVSRLTGMVVLAFTSIIVAYSRVYLGYHSLVQVEAGAVLGSAFAIVWFWFTQRVLQPTVFGYIHSSRVFQYFYLRDSYPIPNVLKFEHECSSRYNDIAALLSKTKKH